MSSTMQVQRPTEEARLSKPDLGVRIVSVDSRIDNITLVKMDGRAEGFKAGQFDFDVDLIESNRTEDSLTISYSFGFGRPSSGQFCKVGGKAVLRFSQFNPKADFHTLGNDITKEMALEIFRKNYETIYLLHDALAIEAPSPWITQDVSLSSRNYTAESAEKQSANSSGGGSPDERREQARHED